MRLWSNSSFYMQLSRCISTIDWKDYSFPIELSAIFENQLTVNVRVYFWTFNFIPLIYMSILVLGPHCLDYSCFVISFEIRNKCKPFYLVLIFKTVLAILSLLGFHMNFRISLSISAKSPAGIFIGGCVEFAD